MKTKINKNDWHFYVPLTLGILIILSSLIFVILNGGRWFRYNPDPQNPKPDEDVYRVFGGAYMLAFFTIQTNFFLGATLVVIAFLQKGKVHSWFFGSNVLITITFLLYWTLLAPFKEDQSEWSSPFFLMSTLFTHGINPLIGFTYMILIRNELEVDKKIIGTIALYMSVYYVFSIIFYGVGGQVVKQDGKDVFQGGIIYGFLNPKKLFFIPLDSPNLIVLAILLNLMVFFIAPFLAILFSVIWIWILKIKTNQHSYYKWVFNLKAKYGKNQIPDQSEF